MGFAAALRGAALACLKEADFTFVENLADELGVSHQHIDVSKLIMK